jgi:hypothetical protein
MGMEETEKEVIKCFHDHNWESYAKTLLVLIAVLLVAKFLDILLAG